MITISPTLARLSRGLTDSAKLEKVAGVASGKDLEAVLIAKRDRDNELFELAKQASMLESIGNGARAAWANPVGRKFIGGAAAAAGAAVPTVMAGRAVADHATEQARNRALEAGVGMAGLGATMYGIHHMMGPKTASAIDDILEKLAHVAYLDVQLETLPGKTGEELRALNREFGVELLRQLVR